MKSGIEVLGDLLSFFESSSAFISVACEKLRKQHGPNFKMSTVKAILNLRSDLTKEDRQDALKICKEVLDSYQDGKYDQKLKSKGGTTMGIFEELNTSVVDQNKSKDTSNVEDTAN